MLEVRWHGRGGQGAVTSVELLALAAIGEGRFAQGFPSFGPERRGAPVAAFNRVDEKRIRRRCVIASPDVVVVLDESLIGPEDVCEGLAEGGSVIINTRKNASAFAGLCRGRIWTVDATTIALDEIGRPIPNMPMVGALLRVTGILGVEELIEGVKREFSRKFDQKTIDGNLRAIRRAHAEVRCDG